MKLLVHLWLVLKLWFMRTIYLAVERRLLQLEVEAEHEVKKLTMYQDHARQRMRDGFNRDRQVLTARLDHLGDRLRVLVQLVTKPPAKPQIVREVVHPETDLHN